ncbi:putative F-box protein At3g58960 [Lycium barbarum]|uniref:putative F-box protein At3g58960 n=1 Tax=Lycium barbarum TaxID=112863 RepID=UPI00293F2431|nr:putative F-box protein At3g58960 [Lycium barbarum]
MEEKCVDAAEDHISKLPVPILQHFLSLLLAKDAAQISTFSKKWYTAWSSLSYLKFGDEFFYRENITELLNVVDQTLANRQKQKISIREFWLGGLRSCHWSSYGHNWIKTFVACNIKELILTVYRPDDSFNTLPEEIFTAEGLNILDLGGFKLELPPDGIKFSSLRELKTFSNISGRAILSSFMCKLQWFGGFKFILLSRTSQFGNCRNFTATEDGFAELYY